MSCSFYRQSSRDSSPLLPQSTYDLDELPPRPFSDSHSDTSRRSSIPPPDTRVFEQAMSSLPTRPPPPIASSRLFSKSPKESSFLPSKDPALSVFQPAHGAISFSPLAALERRQKVLQKDIQELLDAQSSGLMQGSRSSSQMDDFASDTGSNTPTNNSFRYPTSNGNGKGITIPVRQPKKRKQGLRGARKGLLRAIWELEKVKNAELEVLSQVVQAREESLGVLQGWETKLQGFERELVSLGKRRETREVEDLRHEKSTIDGEIRELESRLLAMRARSRNLAQQIDAIENQQESEASSFREGKRLVESEIKNFLRLAAADSLPVYFAHEERETFLSLPPKRRTLGIAKDWWSKELTGLQEQETAVEKERQALEDGAAMWKETLDQVSRFEEDLRHQLSLGASTLGPEEAMKIQLAKTKDVIQLLEEHMTRATENGWNLLICAVGAELEAFKEGYNTLSHALQLEETTTPEDLMTGDLTRGNQSNIPAQESNGNEPQVKHEESDTLGLLKTSSLANESFKTAEMHADRSESEDDGPDPELLVSHEDTD